MFMANHELPPVLIILRRMIDLLPGRFRRRRKLGPWQVLMIHLFALAADNRPRLKDLLTSLEQHLCPTWLSGAPSASAVSRAKKKLSAEQVRACFATAAAAAEAAQRKSRAWD